MKTLIVFLIAVVVIVSFGSCTKTSPKPPTNPYTQSSGSGCNIQTSNCSGAGPTSNGN